MSRQLVVQVCLPNQTDLDFLKAYAADKDMSLSAALLDMCNFYDKKTVYLKKEEKLGCTIKDMMIPSAPLDKYKEY